MPGAALCINGKTEVVRRAGERLIHEYFFLMQANKFWAVLLRESKLLATCLGMENTGGILGLMAECFIKVPTLSDLGFRLSEVLRLPIVVISDLMSLIDGFKS